MQRSTANGLQDAQASDSHATKERRGTEPAHRRICRAPAALGDALHRDVPVGENAVQPVVGAADRQRADAEIAHPLRGGRDAVVRADALGSRMHDVARLPGRVLFSGLATGVIFNRLGREGKGSCSTPPCDKFKQF
jgi:hypothetical protein